MKKIVFVLLGLMIIATACKKQQEGVSLVKVALRDKPTSTKGEFKYTRTINRGQKIMIAAKQKKGSKWLKVVLADGETTGYVDKKWIHAGKKELITITKKTRLFDQPDDNAVKRMKLHKGMGGIIVLKKKQNWTKVSVDPYRRGWIKNDAYTVSAGGSEDVKATYEKYIPGIGKCTIQASSTLKGAGNPYSPLNLFDGKKSTTWQEGKDGGGIGEWVEVVLPNPVNVNVSMINGFAVKDKKYKKYGADGDLYVLNNRVKNLRVEYWQAGGMAKKDKVVKLDDLNINLQDVGIFNNVVKLRFIIENVYPGKKWKDTAISEIKLEKVNK